MSRGPVLAALALLAWGTIAPRAAAQPAHREPPLPAPHWRAAVDGYLADPVTGRRRLVALARRGSAGQPAPFLLAIADALVRGGRLEEARTLLRRVVAEQPGEPWQAWAELGLGWLAIHYSDGHSDGSARDHFALAERGSGDAGRYATMMVALVDAAAGHGGAAAVQLDAVAAAETTSAELRPLAQLAAGYARYWAGLDAEAVATFEKLAASADGPLADDARYGAARTRYRSGDGVAVDALRALAGTARGRRRPAPPRGLVDLEPDATFLAAFRAFRRSPPGEVRPPEARAVELFDRDGAALALAAVRLLGEPRTPDVEPAAIADPTPDVDGMHARAGSPSLDAAAPPVTRAPDGASEGWPLGWIALATAAAAALLAIRRPPVSGDGRRLPRSR